MKIYETINELLSDISNNKVSEKEVEIYVSDKSNEYGIKYFSPDTREQLVAYQKLYSVYKKFKSNQILPIVSSKKETILKKCSCGHTISSELVMVASMGTSCPDCYDRMSD